MNICPLNDVFWSKKFILNGLKENCTLFGDRHGGLIHGSIFNVISTIDFLPSHLKVTSELLVAHTMLPSSRQSRGGVAASSILTLRTVRGEGGFVRIINSE